MSTAFKGTGETVSLIDASPLDEDQVPSKAGFQWSNRSVGFYFGIKTSLVKVLGHIPAVESTQATAFSCSNKKRTRYLG